jgi:hypothetical protein
LFLLLPILLPLGLFLPGYFVAKCLRTKLWAPSAFVFSLPILFYCVFWLGVFGVAIRLLPVAGLLIAASAVAFWFAGRFSPMERAKKTPWTKLERALLWGSAAIGIILLVHSFRAPFAGPDSWFRWDFLARRIFELGRFDFYPPIHPADFKTYFYVDAIPPMIQFERWWLYASAGEFESRLICLLVAGEFACTVAFTYGAASALFSRRAGVLAAALLASSPLYFKAVFFAQETGLTALAIAAMLYFIVTARPGNELPAVVSAGVAAALCALAREYGWIALIAGVVALAWRRTAPKHILVFGAVAAAAAAPWYVRNWIVAGNPLYSLKFFGFTVNSVHAAIVQSYKELVKTHFTTSEIWGKGLVTIVSGSILQLLTGIPGAFLQFRRNGYLLVMAALLVGVWYVSIGYTSGGLEVSLRVLSPAMVVLSITGAALLDGWMLGERWRMAIPIAIGACLLWSAFEGVYFPFDLLTPQPEQWIAAAFPDIAPPVEFQLRDQFAQAIPRGYRLLSDNAYLHAALYDLGIEVAPVWSPEVSFLFSAPPEEADQRLAALHIVSVVWYPASWNAPYLRKASPFFGSLDRWKVLASTGSMIILAPP